MGKNGFAKMIGKGLVSGVWELFDNLANIEEPVCLLEVVSLGLLEEQISIGGLSVKRGSRNVALLKRRRASSVESGGTTGGNGL